MNRLSLRVWGVLCIFGGLMAKMIGPTPRNRAELLGQSAALMVFFVVGMILIVVDLVRSRRR